MKIKLNVLNILNVKFSEFDFSLPCWTGLCIYVYIYTHIWVYIYIHTRPSSQSETRQFLHCSAKSISGNFTFNLIYTLSYILRYPAPQTYITRHTPTTHTQPLTLHTHFTHQTHTPTHTHHKHSTHTPIYTYKYTSV